MVQKGSVCVKKEFDSIPAPGGQQERGAVLRRAMFTEERVIFQHLEVGRRGGVWVKNGRLRKEEVEL